MISVDRDGILKVWDLQGVELTSIPAHSGPISQCAAVREPRTGDDMPTTSFPCSFPPLLSLLTLYLLGGQSGTELLVVTTGLDGATRLWNPLLVREWKGKWVYGMTSQWINIPATHAHTQVLFLPHPVLLGVSDTNPFGTQWPSQCSCYFRDFWLPANCLRGWFCPPLAGT